MNTPMKRCSSKERCVHPETQDGWLPATLEYFYSGKRYKNGLTSQCKKCKYAYCKQHRKDHPDQYRIYSQRFRAKYPEEIKQRDRDWRKKNPTASGDRKRQWSKDHPDADRIYRIEHRDEHRDWLRQWRRAHPEETRQAKQRRRSKEKGLPSTLTVDDWQYAISYWNGTCAYCGQPPRLFDKTWVLHQEHFIPLSAPTCTGTIPTNILPACQSCNFSKSASDPIEWITRKFGKRKGKKILKRIYVYFQSITVC